MNWMQLYFALKILIPLAAVAVAILILVGIYVSEVIKNRKRRP
jgi:hypothetical protein